MSWYIQFSMIFLLLISANCKNPDDQGNEGNESFRNLLDRSEAHAYRMSRQASLSLAPMGEEVHEVKADPGTGLPGEVVFDLGHVAPVGADAVLEYGRQVLNDWDEKLGFEADQMVLSKRGDIRPNESLRILHYSRFYEGIPVTGSFVKLIFHKNKSEDHLFKLGRIINRSFGPISPVNFTARILESDDIENLTGLAGIETESLGPLIQVVRGEQSYAFHRAEQYLIRNQHLRPLYYLTLAAETNEMLAARRYASHARLMANVYERSYTESKLTPFPLAHLTGSDGETDEQGRIDQEGRLQIALSGKFARVGDFTGRGRGIFDGAPIPQFDEAVQLDVDIKAEGDTLVDDEQERYALNTYVAINRINAFAKQFLSLDQVPFLGEQLTVRVNLNEECNAFYVPQENSLNFFTSLRQCGNSAGINDIVYHEWGHGLDEHTGPLTPTPSSQRIGDEAFSEGIGDIVSMLFVDDPVLGEGFYLNKKDGVRNADNTATEEDIPSGTCDPRRVPLCEIHERGTIISGSFYDLKVALKNRYGPQTGRKMASDLFFKHLLTTGAYLDSYSAVQALNGTKGAAGGTDFCLIRDAFNNHGLTDDEPCKDNNFIPFDKTMMLAIDERDSEDEKVRLLASHKDADEIALCMGEKFACLKSQKRELKLVFDYQAGERKIYKATEAISIENGQEVTLFAIKDGQIIAARGVRFESSGS